MAYVRSSNVPHQLYHKLGLYQCLRRASQKIAELSHRATINAGRSSFARIRRAYTRSMSNPNHEKHPENIYILIAPGFDELNILSYLSTLRQFSLPLKIHLVGLV